jgi:cytochrome c-type biogenesis protein CcmH/NrfG
MSLPAARFAVSRENLRARVWRKLQALTVDAHDAGAWHELGSALMLLGDRAGACAAWRNALRLDGSRAPTQRALGNLLFDCGQLEPALRCFELAREGAEER